MDFVGRQKIAVRRSFAHARKRPQTGRHSIIGALDMVGYGAVPFDGVNRRHFPHEKHATPYRTAKQKTSEQA